jgi:methionyl-tRNA formyltransferase
MARVFLISSHYMGVLYMQELLKAGDDIVGVVAWPDSGGWYVPEAYDVRTHAFRNYLPLYEPNPKKLNSPEFLSVMRNLEPDFVISGYYPKIFKDDLLAIPKNGCVNIHPTGLPRFRGLSPYFTHILFGDDRNYITMHWLDRGVDTGDIIAQASVEILPDDTGVSCGHRLTEAGAAMFAEYWPQIKNGTSPRAPQDASVASVFNFDWSMAEIDWTKSNTAIWNLVRSLTAPLNGAWTMAGGHKLHIWQVRVVPQAEEIPNAGAVPRQVLALTGKGLWVQCGEGQLEIIHATYDEMPDRTPFEVLAPAQQAGAPPILLG